MFRKPSNQSRHEAVKAIMNAKMKVGSSVREHVLKMISHINEAELHGATIDEATQVGMILETLSHDFLQFKSNYVMNKLSYNLTELLNELQTFESISKEKEPETKAAEGNIAEAEPSSSKDKKRKRQTKGKGKNNSGGNKKKKKNNNNKNKSSKVKKPKRKCFHCGVDGH